MMRLLGILVGSAMALGLLIVLVGIPEFPDDPEPVAPVAASAADRVEPQTTVAEVVEPAPAETRKQPLAEAANVPEVPPIVPEVPATVPDAASTEPEDPAVEETHWYAFWSPFRSEFAANGFVTQLQRTTGLDYRVIKQEPGVYEVAFAYHDDADAQLKLAQISAATGLDLPES